MKGLKMDPHTEGQYILISLLLSFDWKGIVFEMKNLVQLGMPAGEIISSNHVLCKHHNWTS